MARENETMRTKIFSNSLLARCASVTRTPSGESPRLYLVTLATAFLFFGLKAQWLQHLLFEQVPQFTDFIAAGFVGAAGAASFLNKVHRADAIKILRMLPPWCVQTIIADPPYFRVLGSRWDNQWAHFDEYLEWSLTWLRECMRVLRPDGLCFVFGQVGRRQWGFFDFCARATHLYQFHDLFIWDRAVGYQRRDSLDPAYELILVLRNSDRTKFFKNTVRTPYDAATIATYAKDKRYEDPAARLKHLKKGKYATNILRVPSLRGCYARRSAMSVKNPSL